MLHARILAPTSVRNGYTISSPPNYLVFLALLELVVEYFCAKQRRIRLIKPVAKYDKDGVLVVTTPW